MKKENKKPSGVFWYLFILSMVLLLWQIAMIVHWQFSGFVIDTFTSGKMHLPWHIFLSIAEFVFIQIILYLLFTIVVWGIARLIAQYFNLSVERATQFTFFLWCFGVVTILLANAVFYPASLFAGLVEVFPYFINEALLLVCILFLVGCLSIVFLQFLHLFWRSRAIAKIYSLIILLIVIGLVLYLASFTLSVTRSKHSNKPNIIIIGLDALRPDHIGYFGYPKNNMPVLDKFLTSSTNFTTSITPMARTYTAWASILTGQYPVNSGIRFNLEDQSHLQLHNTLSAILQRQGYYTIYATDDERFSNITSRFGFNKIIGTKPGAEDFLLGTLNDLPLSNLIVNTKLGAILFPYSFGNRPAFATYRPNVFVEKVAHQMRKMNNRPIFLSIHLCLTHWPYVWASSLDYSLYTTEQLYEMAAKRIDRQFDNLLQVLTRDGLLENSIVIVLSDHGESFGQPDDRMIAMDNYLPGKASRKNIVGILNKLSMYEPGSNKLEILYGHGTDVLSYTQYHTLLSLRCFGYCENAQQNINSLVSLVDIKPTILNMLNISSSDSDGESLLPFIKSQKMVAKPRMIFAETGFTPTAMTGESIAVGKILLQSFRIFEINPETDKVTMRAEAVDKLLKTKELAVYYKNWVLALYPDFADKMVPILVNRKTGQWTDDLQIPFAKNSPGDMMLATLKRFYAYQ
jgi:hypothetical protein